MLPCNLIHNLIMQFMFLEPFALSSVNKGLISHGSNRNVHNYRTDFRTIFFTQKSRKIFIIVNS